MTTSLELAVLFFWSFLAATIFPVGSEPALVALTRSGERIWLLFAIATLGNYLGACTTYAIARARQRKQRLGSNANPASARSASLTVTAGPRSSCHGCP